MQVQKTSYMQKRLYFEFFYMMLQKCKKLANIIGDSIIMFHQIDAEAKPNNEKTKATPTSFKEENITQNFYISLAFSLITITLFIVVSIFCYLINY